MATPKKIGSHAQVSYRMVDPKELMLNPNNQRDYDAADPDMVSLRQSLVAQGVLTALEIYEDGVVHDGNRRLFNINILLGEGVWTSTVPAIIVPRPENEVEATIARLNKNEARQFSALEQARAFATLRDGGLNNSQIAAKTPFTSMHVGNMLTLHDAGDDVRAAVKARQVSATFAVDTIRRHGDAVLIEAVALALEQGKDRVSPRHVDAVLASKVEPVAAPQPDPTTPVDATPVDATVEPVVDATPVDATVEPVADAVVADATANIDPPFDLDSTPPAPPVIADAQEIVVADATVADAVADATPTATAATPAAITARSVLVQIAPTLSDLLLVITGGTKAERLEALMESKDELTAFVQAAKKLGLLKD
jgi:hypothetical protein